MMLHSTPAIAEPRSAPPRPVAAPLTDASPSGEPGEQPSLWRRLRSPHTIASFVFAALVLWFAMRRLAIDPAATWAQVRQANPVPLLGALALWYGSFFLRSWRWRRMIEAVNHAQGDAWRVPATRRLAEIVTLAWFANSLVPAKLGDAWRGYMLKREGGVPFSVGIGTILAERFVDAMMLLVVLATSATLVFGSDLPEQARPAVVLGGILLVVAPLGLVGMWLTRDLLIRYLPFRVQDAYARLQGAVFQSLRNPAPILATGLLLWCGDGLRVWLVARSLDVAIPPVVAILVAVMSALLTIIPFTPAGLGVVELGIGAMLIGVFGLEPVTAGSIILLDRVVVYWSLLVVGGVLYARRTRREFLGAGPNGTPA